MVLVGLLQVLTLLRGWILTLSTFLNSILKFPIANIELVIFGVISLFLSYQIINLFINKNKFLWTLGFASAIFWLLKFYGL